MTFLLGTGRASPTLPPRVICLCSIPAVVWILPRDLSWSMIYVRLNMLTTVSKLTFKVPC